MECGTGARSFVKCADDWTWIVHSVVHTYVAEIVYKGVHESGRGNCGYWW